MPEPEDARVQAAAEERDRRCEKRWDDGSSSAGVEKELRLDEAADFGRAAAGNRETLDVRCDASANGVASVPAEKLEWPVERREASRGPAGGRADENSAPWAAKVEASAASASGVCGWRNPREGAVSEAAEGRRDDCWDWGKA
jgi:hypothetical protein